MKKFSKLFMVIAAVAMVFSFSLGVAAQDYYTGTDASYDVTELTTSPSTVVPYSINIQSNQLGSNKIYTTFSGTLTGATSYTVLDAILNVQANNSIEFLDVHGDAINASDDYFESILYGGVTYAPSEDNFFGTDGWCFRIDTLFPFVNLSGGDGAAINQTYLDPAGPNDITLYYNDIFYFPRYGATNLATDFTRIKSVNVVSGALQVAVESSIFRTDENMTQMIISPYAAFGGATVAVTVGGTTYTEITNTNGIARITVPSPVAGTYTVSVLPRYIQNGDDKFWDDYYDNTGFLYNTGQAVSFTVNP